VSYTLFQKLSHQSCIDSTQITMITRIHHDSFVYTLYVIPLRIGEESCSCVLAWIATSLRHRSVPCLTPLVNTTHADCNACTCCSSIFTRCLSSTILLPYASISSITIFSRRARSRFTDCISSRSSRMSCLIPMTL